MNNLNLLGSWIRRFLLEYMVTERNLSHNTQVSYRDALVQLDWPPESPDGFAPIFPDTCYHLTHYWPAAADIPVASDNP
ncbi:hypothetical protein KI999_22505, partial [Escherichia marmotae]|nr:hypothetical protein [Escherichia marmotae]